MKKFLLTAIMLLPMIAVNAQQFAPKRPPITGIAHIGLYTDDLKNAEDLFCDYLGFGKPYYIKRAGRPDMMFIKINDRQYVEFFQDTEKRLVKYRHAAFETTDVEAMRLYLQSVGIKVPDKVTYKKQDKQEYLTNLKGVFARNSYIRVAFDEVEVKFHPTVRDIYGVTLHQGYSASGGYHDEGYVFLLWDFTNEDEPKIHVRTWQPDRYDTNGRNITKDEVFSCNDFDI